jgi:hypothetical protein
VSEQPYTGSNLGPLTRGGDGWDAFPIAGKSADAWDAFPEAKKADTTTDVVKSIGSGIVKGYTGLAGLPGDALVLAAKGAEAASNFVNDKLGVKRFDPMPDEPPSWVPTSARLTKTVEDTVTGDLHRPETRAGRYAETISSFVPAAIAGPGGVARKIAMQAALPGAASEAAGEATAGTAAEPYARVGGALIGGGVGAVATRPSSVTGALRSQLPEGITQATVDNARSLMQSAQSKGITLSWPEALSQVAGRPVLADTQRILESAPSSRTRMQDFYADRPQQFDQAALNELHNVAPGTATPSQIGPQVGKAANEHLADVRQTINQAAEPYYANAEGVLLSPAEMSHVRRIPGYQQARDAVRENPQLNSYVSHLPDNSVGFLNEVKKYFDQQGQNASSKFNQSANQQVAAVHGKAAEVVKQIGELKSADYAAALGIQKQGRERYLDPLMQGPLGRLAKKDVTTQRAIAALFPENPLPNSHHEIETTVRALAAKNPGAATQLVRAHIEATFNEATRSLQGGPNQFGAAGFAKKLVGNIQQRANLEAAITALPNGKQIWNGFDNFLEAAEATGTRQAKGSLTAFNAQELKAASGSNIVGEAIKTGLSPGKWWSVVNDKWGQWKLGRNLDELARILTDPASGPVFKRIAAMPKGSREAGYLVSRLILQSSQAGRTVRDPSR